MYTYIYIYSVFPTKKRRSVLSKPVMNHSDQLTLEQFFVFLPVLLLCGEIIAVKPP